ncbi:RNA methyltransferase [Halorientalis halophila]|uniref:RNA methyltransferase n=1 Tax=Halorientalis halophila TaxID=3108499 RepID=UPI00300929C4
MTVSVLVPSSLTREAEDKREATRKLGYVARAATVFRVDRLVVFPDPGGTRGQFGDGFVETVLRYAATPPYLRKEAWGKRDELEYAGVLPPLRVSPRTGSGSDDSGSLRQGIVTEVGSDGRVRVNCGLQHPISLPAPDGGLSEGERVSIRVSSRRPVRAKFADASPPGYVVEASDLSTELSRDDAGIRLATSRHGEQLSVDRLGDIVAETDTRGMTVAFGAPERGLPEILDVSPPGGDEGGEETERESTALREPDGSRFDLWLNAVPNQGSEVVRTEEAMFAVLACLSLTE